MSTALSVLNEATTTLERELGSTPRSLAPDREHATPLAELHATVLDSCAGAHHARLFGPLAEGLARLALAQLEAFPGNLFWDLDHIAAAIVTEACPLESEAARACVEDRFDRMARLQHLYGRATAINFSYVHDFVYGFDWAKWVAREPALHADVPGPFSLRFLDYMERRGHELLELIANDDRKYPSLQDDRPRNPFSFSREPEAEVRLHGELARQRLIPVETWALDGGGYDWSTRWQIAFQDRRVAVAEGLGLGLTG